MRQDVLNKQLLKSREEFESSDYLSRDSSDGHDEEEWRISLRLLADENVDYGLFVHEIQRQVEPFLDAANDPNVPAALRPCTRA